MKQVLNFIQSCVRAEVSTDDLGYLTKWALKDYENVVFETFLAKIEEMIEQKFFDHNQKISKIVNNYKNQKVV
jgi:hypothetical protein